MAILISSYRFFCDILRLFYFSVAGFASFAGMLDTFRQQEVERATLGANDKTVAGLRIIVRVICYIWGVLVFDMVGDVYGNVVGGWSVGVVVLLIWLTGAGAFFWNKRYVTTGRVLQRWEATVSATSYRCMTIGALLCGCGCGGWTKSKSDAQQAIDPTSAGLGHRPSDVEFGIWRLGIDSSSSIVVGGVASPAVVEDLSEDSEIS